MNAIVDAVLGWFADYYLFTTFLLTLVLLAGTAMRQPARRLGLAWATVTGLLLLGGLIAVPGWSVMHLFGDLPAKPSVMILPANTPPAASPDHLLREIPLATPPGPANLPTIPSPTTAPLPASPSVVPDEVREINLSASLLAPLLLGSAAAFIWLLLGAWQTHRLLSASSPPTPEIENLLASLSESDLAPPRLRLSHQVGTGVALGLLRPTILLPQSYADRYDAHALRSVLAHELAHVRHGDLWMLAVLRCLMVALWAHPLYWLLRRRVRIDQEVLADAEAADLTSRTDYAEQLVGWARELDTLRPPTLAGAVGLWETKSQLRRRIAVLLDERLTLLRNCSRSWKWGSLLLCAVIAIALSLVTVQPDEAMADEVKTIVSELKYYRLKPVGSRIS